MIDVFAMPPDTTARERVVAEALYAETWTQERADQPNPDWHHRFPWWQCVLAARIAVPALDRHDDEEATDGC